MVNHSGPPNNIPREVNTPQPRPSIDEATLHSCPSSLDAGEAITQLNVVPQLHPSDPFTSNIDPKFSNPTRNEKKDTTESNNIPQTTPPNIPQTTPPNEAHQRTESLLTGLRTKTGNKNAPTTSCKDCMMCTDCNVQTTNKNKTKPNPKPSRGRGRPRKTVISNVTPTGKETVNTEQIPQDFRSLLMEIKDEVSTVSEKQEACREDLSILMNTKMNDFKESLGKEIKNVKENIKTTTTLLSDLKESQILLGNKFENAEKMKTEVEKNSLSLSELKYSHVTLNAKEQTCDEKMITLEDKTCDLEIDIIRQKKGVDQVNQSLSQHIAEVEYGLAAHIETVKNNVEAELGGAKQIQMSHENRLANFTLEIKNQKDELKNKLKYLQGDLEQIKTLSDRDSSIPNSPNSSTYVPVDNSLPEDAHRILSQNSCLPNPLNVPDIPNPFYMYGDSTRALIIDGIHETRGENLGEIILHCINDIGVKLAHDDIEEVFRIGKRDTSRQWPRPIKLVLKDQLIRDQIFIFKARLRFSHVFKNVRVNKEQRKDVRIKIAKLRQASQAAKTFRI